MGDYKEKTKKVIVLGGALKKHGPKERHTKAVFAEDKKEREKASKAIAKAEKKMKASHVELSRKGHEKSLKERARKEKPLKGKTKEAAVKSAHARREKKRKAEKKLKSENRYEAAAKVKTEKRAKVEK